MLRSFWHAMIFDIGARVTLTTPLILQIISYQVMALLSHCFHDGRTRYTDHPMTHILDVGDVTRMRKQCKGGHIGIFFTQIAPGDGQVIGLSRYNANSRSKSPLCRLKQNSDITLNGTSDLSMIVLCHVKSASVLTGRYDGSISGAHAR